MINFLLCVKYLFLQSSQLSLVLKVFDGNLDILQETLQKSSFSVPASKLKKNQSIS